MFTMVLQDTCQLTLIKYHLTTNIALQSGGIWGHNRHLNLFTSKKTLETNLIFLSLSIFLRQT